VPFKYVVQVKDGCNNVDYDYEFMFDPEGTGCAPAKSKTPEKITFNNTDNLNVTDSAEPVFNFTEAFELVKHLFEDGYPVTDEVSVELLRLIFPYPVPYVARITPTGYVNVKFSRDLVFENGFENAETKSEYQKQHSDYVDKLLEEN